MNLPARVLIALFCCIPMCAQMSRGGRSGIGRGDGINPVVDAVASFDGVFKSADKKFVEIQMESGDVMRMYLTRSTKFVIDGKPVKASAFHDGDKVTADATRDARLNMLAVKIENRKAEDKQSK
jgi:hypothetical protein